MKIPKGSRPPCQTHRPGFEANPRLGDCNYCAEMEVLNAGHFAGLGVGNAPNHPMAFCGG